jgi:hypothetical protein
MRKAVMLLLIACALSASFVVAQNHAKPWTQWSEKDAKKTLEDSPWAQTLVQIDAPQMFPNAGQYLIIPKYYDPSVYSRPDQKLADIADPVNYHIRFLSAKPVRQALVRVAELQQQKADPELLKGQRDFVESKFDQWIVVAVVFTCKNQRYYQPVMQLFNGATLSTLKNSVFLELNDGRRLFLEDYTVPSTDGLGAKFMFSRKVKGTPFITAKSKTVRFFARLTSSEASRPLIFNMRFNIADFRYEGVLEF